MQYKKASVSELNKILQLLQEVNYPEAPESVTELSKIADNGLLYAMYDKDVLAGVVLLYKYKQLPELVGFDVAVRPEYAGRWGNKGLFSKVFGYAFGELGGFAVVARSRVPGAINGLQRLGFTKTGENDNGEQVFTLLKQENRFAA